MRVKRLKMQSFRGIGDLTLEFDEREPTVLIGINGVGKSSILDCLAILLSQLTGQIQDSLESIRFFSTQDIMSGCDITHNQITLELEMQEFKWSLANAIDYDLQALIKETLIVEKELRSNFKNYKNVDNILMRLKNARTIIETEIMDKLSENVKTVIEKLNNLLRTIPDANIPLVVCYNVNRAVIDMPLEISDVYSFKQVDAYEQALNGGRIDFKIFFEWFRNREDLENEIRRDNSEYRDKQLEAVRQAISSLIPDFSNLRVQRSPLRMTVQKHDEELMVHQLSDGEKCLLAMVGDLARRLAIANPGLSDPLQGSAVVLIDEIELHLHPKWQRGIILDLTRTFPNCQFIVTTHSPQVIGDVKPQGIYILEKTDKGVIAKRPESSYGRDSNYILENIMDDISRRPEIKEGLLELFRLIDAGDLTGARELRQQLAAEIGTDEPEFVKADVLIRRKEIIGR